MRDGPSTPVDPKLLKPIFYWSGLTLHACQSLEYGVKVLLVAMAEAGFGVFDADKAIDIIEERTKKTFGQILRDLQDRVSISDGWRSKLESALEERNRFVHHFLVDAAEAMADPWKRDDVLQEIKLIRRKIQDGHEALEQMLKTVFAFGGVDFDQVASEIHAEVRILNEPAP